MKVTTQTVIITTAGLLAMVLLVYYHNGGSNSRKVSSMLPAAVIVQPTGSQDERSQTPTLPQEVIDKVKTFFVFLGYARSGHTILGALMDAHPNIVVSHQYSPCGGGGRLGDKTRLFNKMYQNSYRSAMDENGARSLNHNKKNYTAHVPNSWQGHYDKYIQVIGDKDTCDLTAKKINMIHKNLQTDVKTIIPIRNPFDLITTGVLYQDFKRLVDILQKELDIHLSKEEQHDAPIVVARYKQAMKELLDNGDESKFQSAMYDNPRSVERNVHNTARRTSNIVEQARELGWDNVLKIHNMDVVNNPLLVVNKMCTFFKVSCPPSYVQSFVDKVFQSVSKTRSLIVWPPRLKDMVETEMITKFEMFNRYSFESD